MTLVDSGVWTCDNRCNVFDVGRFVGQNLATNNI
jgi:hypothetical protein